jgi:sensor histidine kinase regulating citrate/malate metabolism
VSLIVDALSRDLGKEKPHITVTNPGFSISDEGSDILQNVFVHVIRNSIDHGLETGTERIKKGKLPEGNITIDLSENSGFMEIAFSDDGAGLNLSKLRQLGLARSLLSEEHKNDPMAVALVIFEDGLSTAPMVSDISGRGVGMSAVKRYIEQAGGKLQLCFHETPSIESTGVAFGIVISLPSRYYNYTPAHQAA